MCPGSFSFISLISKHQIGQPVYFNSGVTLLLDVFKNELESILSERSDKFEILAEIFDPKRKTGDIIFIAKV